METPHSQPMNAGSALVRMRSTEVRHYADGGLVRKTTSKLMPQPGGAAAAMAAPPAMPTPAPNQGAPAAQPAASAAPAAPAARTPKGAGMIKGAGTGTSDSIDQSVQPGSFIVPADTTKKVGAAKLASLALSATAAAAPDAPAPAAKKVPVKVSNGEFKLPPEAVHAVGAKALQTMVDQTHKPVGKSKTKGGKPARADGGFVPYDPTMPKSPLALPAPAVTGTALAPVGPATVGQVSAQQTLATAPNQIIGRRPPINMGMADVVQPPGLSGPAAAPAAAPVASAAPAASTPALPKPAASPMSLPGAPGSLPQAGLTGAADAAGTAASSAAPAAAAAEGAVPAAAGRSGAASVLGKVAGPIGTALGIAAEGKQVYDVASNPNATGLDVATQAAQGAGRLGAAGAGAAGGAALGALGGPLAPVTVPVGAVVGGALGYLGADKAIQAGRSALGVNPASPADQAAQAPAAAPAPVTGPPSNAASTQINASQIPNAAAPNGAAEILAANTPSPVQTPSAGSAGATPPAPPVQAPPPPAAAAPGPGDVTRDGNSYSGTNVSGNVSVNGQPTDGGVTTISGGVSAADRLAQTQRDSQHLADMAGIQRQVDANNGQSPGMVVIDGAAGDAARRAQFNNEANLHNALMQTSWSPRRGTQGNDAAVQAALAPIAAQDKMAQLATQNAGETQRAQIQEQGLDARSRLANTLAQQQQVETVRHNTADEALKAQAEVGAVRRAQMQYDPFGLSGTGGAPAAGVAPAGPAGAAPQQAPGSGPQGPALLKTLPPAVGDQVKALAEGRLAFPGGMGLKSPYWQGMMSLVSQYDPSFDAINYGTRAATRKDFTTGKSAQSINALNTVTGHLESLSNAADALNNTSYPALNSVANAAVSATGDPRVKQFEATKKAVVDELTKAWRGSGGSEGDIKTWSSTLDAANSPAQLHGVIGQMGELLGSKIGSLNDQYNKGMGTTEGGLTLMSPHAAQALQSIRKRAGLPTDDAMAATAAPATPGAQPAAAQAPARINTAADHAALPSGATYIAPDGTLRRKS